MLKLSHTGYNLTFDKVRKIKHLQAKSFQTTSTNKKAFFNDYLAMS